MPIAQIIINESSNVGFTGIWQFDSGNGGRFSGPAGAVFPTTNLIEGIWFWRTDERRLYRYSGTVWEAVVSDVGSDEMVKLTVDDPTAGYLIAKLTEAGILADIASKAPKASPNFTGTPVAPTASQGTNNTQLATTAFVNAEIAADAAPIAHVGATGAAHGVATGAVNGFMASADKTKLDTIASGAEVNVNADWNAASGDAQILNKPATFPPSAHNHAQSEITNLVSDLAAKAPIASPTFTGVPAAPTAAQGTNTTQIASTAYVKSEIGATAAPIAHVGATGTAHGVATGAIAGFMAAADKTKLDGIEPGAEVNVNADWNSSSGDSQIMNKPAAFPPSTHSHAQSDVTNLVSDLALKAPLANPTFTGVPAAPTAITNTSTTQIATTAFVNAEIAADAAPIAHVGATGTAHGVATGAVNGFMAAADKTKLDGVASGAEVNVNADWNAASGDAQILNKPATFPPSAHNHAQSEVTNLVSDLAAKAPLASPALTGVPSAPTATQGTDTTQLATTAFVNAEIAADAAPLSHVGATGTAHGVATTSLSGFMSGVDKVKLDGIAPNATNTPITNTAPANVTKSAAVVGVSTEVARSDHKHDVTTAAPSSVGTANAEGSSTSLARADHVHSHGNQAGGSLHATATTSIDGFMSAGDKSKLDGMTAGATGWSGFDDTNVSINNNAVEVEIFSRSIPANTLASEGQMISALAIGSVTCTTTARSFTLRLKIGGTTVYADATGNLTASNTARFVTIEMWLIRTSATTADLVFNYFVGNAGTTTTGDGDLGGASFRSCAARATRNFAFTFSNDNTLSATIQLGAASTQFYYTHDAVYFFAPGGTGGVAGTSPLTTKGDLYTRTVSADARLPVGPDGSILAADSAEATGVKWVPSQAAYNVFTASMNAEQASATCFLCKNPDNQSNPGGLAISHSGNLFKNGYLDPFSAFGDQEIIEIGVVCAGVATGYGTVGASPTIRVDCYIIERDSETFLTTQRAVILGTPVIGIWNNLSTSTGLVKAGIVLASPVAIPGGSLFGFRLIPESANDTQINAVAMPRVSVKTRYT